MQSHARTVLFCTTLLTATAAQAGTVVEMRFVDEQGVGKAAGEISITETQYGLVFTPALDGLPPGVHGFHVHERPSCTPAEKDGKMTAAAAAGGHYDPGATQRHDAPWGDGHIGDLPALYVGSDGNAVHPVLAPRLHMADLQGRSLMLHAGGENYADEPAPLGGGGPRLLCGVIE